MSGKQDQSGQDHSRDQSPSPAQGSETHTGGGAPTNKAHEEAGDGTLAGSVPAGLSSEELRKLASGSKTDDGGTG
ncbi:hypothetical protein [Roseomonas populi]|uniref:DUF3072 domain-containing protein n=1 Tax=Roseomonas populi TaxID=3121582 RepID=A0ABT1XD52_9PROT|nr:hypothetical protein [Roseomonas pecuniae]MCR0985368.1 hypothetical protein [Roseomonas pecuniae]